MPSLGMAEILVIAVVALLFLGPDKLPKAARQLGKGLRELRKHSDNVKTELKEVVDLEGVAEMHRDFKEAVDFRSVLTDVPVRGTASSGVRANGGSGPDEMGDTILDASALDSDVGSTRTFSAVDEKAGEEPAEEG